MPAPFSAVYVLYYGRISTHAGLGVNPMATPSVIAQTILAHCMSLNLFDLLSALQMISSSVMRKLMHLSITLYGYWIHCNLKLGFIDHLGSQESS